jgi:hypothetical protein
MLQNDVESFIPATKAEKVKNHFHEKVEVDDGTLTTIQDYFLSNKKYKKL